MPKEHREVMGRWYYFIRLCLCILDQIPKESLHPIQVLFETCVRSIFGNQPLTLSSVAGREPKLPTVKKIEVQREGADIDQGSSFTLSYA